MTLIRLFARSRQVGPAGAGLASICLCTWLWGKWLGIDDGALLAVLIISPLSAGAVLGGVTDSPFGEVEQIASRSLVGLRTIHVSGLLAFVAAGLVAATWSWDMNGASELALRNLAAFTGLSLLAALVVGGRLAWIVPVVYGLGSYALIDTGSIASWLLPSTPAGTYRATATAIAVLLAGITLIALRGAHDVSDH